MNAPQADFVIFPPRWLVAENAFRPAWYYMNIMSETRLPQQLTK